MAIALSIVGIAFAAFCVWLTVRIVNRRERWAKWTLAAVLLLGAVTSAAALAIHWLLKPGAYIIIFDSIEIRRPY
jgi:H+/Cl- antiporter ClcA